MTEAVPTSAVPRVPGVETLAPEGERSRPSADASLVFDNISKAFPDGTIALVNVTFDVRPGEFVTVVGPSGCGKSTLLRIASGLTPTSSGVVRVNRDSLGYVFQDPTLLQWRTVRRNVELLAELHGVGKVERGRLAQEAIDLVGLTGFEDKYPKQLSGGMRMRASLARSLTLSPNVFLFDEPFGALDEITRERLNDELLTPVLVQGLRVALHHPLDLRGRVPLDPGDRDVGTAGPDRRRLRGAVRLSPLAGASLRVELRRADRGGLARVERGPLVTSVDVRPVQDDLEQALLEPPPRRSAWKSFLVEVIGPFIVFWIVIGVWYFISYRLLKPHRRFLMPPPHRVLDVAFLDSRNRSELLNGLWNSTKVAMVGLAIAIVLGMLFAILMSQAKWIERSLFPYAVVLQTIPILALVPLIGVLVRLQLPQPRDRVRADRDLPDHQQHALRLVICRPGPARPLHVARRESIHAPLAPAAARGHARDLRGLPHLRRPRR